MRRQDLPVTLCGVLRNGSWRQRLDAEEEYEASTPEAGWPALSSGEIHVWFFSLQSSLEQANRFQALLADEELERASRYGRQHLREQFVTGRGILREILAKYTGQEPSKLQLSYGRSGKPELVPATSHDRADFNMSHSEDVAVCAVGRSGRLGIDIEKALSERHGNWRSIAERYFQAEELHAMERLPKAERFRGFLRYWTLKEAYCKALGKGVWHIRAAPSFQSLRVGETGIREVVDSEGTNWICAPVDLPGDTMGALVAERKAQK